MMGQPNVNVPPPPGRPGAPGAGNILQPNQIERVQAEAAAARQAAENARQNFTVLTQAFASATTGEVRVVPEESTNSLIVRATAADWEVVRQVIQAVDLRPPQVLIEVTIAEVRRSADLDLGISGGATYTKDGRATPSATLTHAGDEDPRAFVLRLAGGRGAVDFDVAIRALESRGDVRILSLPVIFGQNNKEARLNVGSERPFIQTFRTLPTDQGVRDQIVQYRDVGTQLTIIPTINPDGYVNLQVTQTANNATNEIQFGAPVINKREASTQIFVRDGQTAVIGGLADNQRERSRTGLPFFNRIPLIGGLFGGMRNTDVVSELFLFLTPHVVQSDDDTDRIREAIKQNRELLRNVPLAPIIPPLPTSPVVPPPPPPRVPPAQ
jgi:general secretion pathway protein D